MKKFTVILMVLCFMMLFNICEETVKPKADKAEISPFSEEDTVLSAATVAADESPALSRGRVFPPRNEIGVVREEDIPERSASREGSFSNPAAKEREAHGDSPAEKDKADPPVEKTDTSIATPKGGFDIDCDYEFFDYGTICGTCSGPWDAVANRCWHCNPN